MSGISCMKKPAVHTDLDLRSSPPYLDRRFEELIDRRSQIHPLQPAVMVFTGHRDGRLCSHDFLMVSLFFPVLIAWLERNRLSQQILLMARSEEHTSELQSQFHLVCRLLL